jgi:hypothetical protein
MGSGHRELPPAKEVVVVRKFITNEEQSVLLQWAIIVRSMLSRVRSQEK